MDWWRQQVTKTNIAVAQAVDALKNQVRKLLSKKKPITLDAHAKTNKQKNPDLNITGVYLSAWEKQNQVYPTGTHRWFKEKMAVFLFKNLNYCTIPFGIWSDYWHFTTKQNSEVVSFCLWFSVRKNETYIPKIPWRFMEEIRTLHCIIELLSKPPHHKHRNPYRICTQLKATYQQRTLHRCIYILQQILFNCQLCMGTSTRSYRIACRMRA